VAAEHGVLRLLFFFACFWRFSTSRWRKKGIVRKFLFLAFFFVLLHNSGGPVLVLAVFGCFLCMVVKEDDWHFWFVWLVSAEHVYSVVEEDEDMKQ
jgi:hypothetical protein